ncbi:MAG: MFS transporter [Treponema sp.]|nr:MFS transporter [Treponema sp.]
MSGDKSTKMTKQEKSWIMYDWANSVYATIMMAAVFPIYFTGVANSAGQSGDYWWGLATSGGMIILAVLAPMVGALANFMGYKKPTFLVFLGIGIGATLFSAVTNNWVFLMLGYSISLIGFSGGNIVYDSFLSDVTTTDRMDKISGYGFAFGYIGGSTIPFLFSIALITFGSNFGIDLTLAVKISVVITAVWWGLFTIPFLKDVKQLYGVEKPKSHPLIRSAFSAVLETAKKIFKDKRLFFFILAYFFYIDGVGTVMRMATAYGATLGLDATGMILALLVTQLVAFPCSIFFAYLSRRFGTLKIIHGAICVYLTICLVGFVMGFGLEEGYFGVDTALVLFWSLAVLVGTVQGGIQAASRAYYCQMIPPEHSGEFFGFFDIFGRFAAVLGPLIYSVTLGIVGRSSFSILAIVALFLAALVTLRIGKKHLQ